MSENEYENLPMDALADTWIKLSGSRSNLNTKIKLAVDNLKTHIKDVEQYILARLNEVEADAISMHGRNFKKTTTARFSISDKEAFVRYIVANAQWDLITTSACSSQEINRTWEHLEDLPECIAVYQEVKLSVTKLNKTNKEFT